MIVLTIYLCGYVAAYFSIRTMIKHKFDEWMVGDRNISLVYSLLSWLAVIASLLQMFLEKNYDSDKEAKW